MKYIVVVMLCSFKVTIFSMIIDKKEHKAENLGIYLKNCTSSDYTISFDKVSKNICRSHDTVFIKAKNKLHFYYQKVEDNKRSPGYLMSGLKPISMERWFKWHECKSIKITSAYYYLKPFEYIFCIVEPAKSEIPTLYWLAMHAIPADTLEKIPKMYPQLRGEQQL